MSEYAITTLDKYDRKYKFVDVSKDGLNLKEDKEHLKQIEDEFKPLTEYIQEILSDKVYSLDPYRAHFADR